MERVNKPKRRFERVALAEVLNRVRLLPQHPKPNVEKNGRQKLQPYSIRARDVHADD